MSGVRSPENAACYRGRRCILTGCIMKSIRRRPSCLACANFVNHCARPRRRQPPHWSLLAAVAAAATHSTQHPSGRLATARRERKRVIAIVAVLHRSATGRPLCLPSTTSSLLRSFHHHFSVLPRLRICRRRKARSTRGLPSLRPVTATQKSLLSTTARPASPSRSTTISLPRPISTPLPQTATRTPSHPLDRHRRLLQSRRTRPGHLRGSVTPSRSRHLASRTPIPLIATPLRPPVPPATTRRTTPTA